MTKFYTTTSIPYVNAPPHIGYALELVLADVIARTQAKNGKQVSFSIGSDEHGQKIEQKAKSYNLTPLEYTNDISQKFANLAKQLNISNNYFIRTTDPIHLKNVTKIWKLLEKDIYKSKYVGWYCVGDEAFYNENEVQANHGICPNHNTPYEKLEEDNYFFRLSKYNEQVKSVITSGEFRVIPSSRRNEVLSLLNSGIEDISISRPKSKITWGINVPNDPDQVIYVWFEALMNYLTVLNYPSDEKTSLKIWPADVQVIGKDILRFHAAIWPGILLSLGLDLPKILYVHGFITINNKKMSKSLGNVVDPIELIDRYGVDSLRYYLLRHISSYDDGDFTSEKFIAAYNNELANELGNLLSRSVAMINKYFPKGLNKTIPPIEHDTHAYFEAINKFRFDQALDIVWDQIRSLNQYIDEERPWEVAKSDPLHLAEILVYLVSSLTEVAELLEPFLPDTASQIILTLKDRPKSPDLKPLFMRIV